MACNCPPEVRNAPRPDEGRTRHEVLSGGRVVYRTTDPGKAETVAARWPGGTVRSVDATTPYSAT